jgi:exosortase A
MFLKPPPGVINATSAPISRQGTALIVLALLAPFLLYLGTVRSIVSVWNSSETFAHGYVILPISLWLIWRRRENFSLYPPRPWPPALLLLGVLGIGWLAAQLGEVQVVSQYTFVAMLPVAALALFGPRLAGSLAFPLLFLLFAVPFGEIFVGPLIQFTADFTVWAVRATGIPVLRSGTRFELPTGSWSVVEACSGVRYLISSITLGCLYAYLTYRSTARRALFIGLSVIVPIIANGLRAYMIVMIGHLSGMELATGVDHIIYGWLFFGLVMFVMFWIGSFWREDTAAEAAASAATRTAGMPPRLPAMVVGVLLVCAFWPALALVGERANHNPAPVRLADVAVTAPQAADFADWKPFYMEPDARFHQRLPGRRRTREPDRPVLPQPESGQEPDQLHEPPERLRRCLARGRRHGACRDRRGYAGDAARRHPAHAARRDHGLDLQMGRRALHGQRPRRQAVAGREQGDAARRRRRRRDARRPVRQRQGAGARRTAPLPGRTGSGAGPGAERDPHSPIT